MYNPVIDMAEYWDNQPAWKGLGDFMLGESNPPNKSYKTAYRMVQSELQSLQIRAAIEEAKKVIEVRHENL